MKTAGIIKIVVGCVVLVALAAGVVGVFTGRALWRGNRIQLAASEPAAQRAQDAASAEKGGGKPAGSSQNGKPADVAQGSEPAALGGASYAASDVREIELEWIAGSVTVIEAKGEDVLISETSAEALTEAQKLRCTLIGGKLRVQYCDDVKNVWRWFSLGNYSIPAKHLTLALPASLGGALEELDIDTVSADVLLETPGARDTEIETVSGKLRVTGQSCRKINLSSTSGSIYASACKADELDVDTVSGKAEIEGAFGKIEASGVSGSVDIVSTAVARAIEAKTVSGNIRVTLPESAEFTASLDTVSGDLTSEFPCMVSGGRLISGSGSNRYEFESVSGDVRILKAAS